MKFTSLKALKSDDSVKLIFNTSDLIALVLIMLSQQSGYMHRVCDLVFVLLLFYTIFFRPSVTLH